MGNCLIGMLDQIAEKLKFFWGEMSTLIPVRDGSGHEVDLELTRANSRRCQG